MRVSERGGGLTRTVDNVGRGGPLGCFSMTHEAIKSIHVKGS